MAKKFEGTMAKEENGDAQMEAESSTEAHPKPEPDDKADQAAPDEAMGGNMKTGRKNR